MNCPHCLSEQTRKDGTRAGKQRYRCPVCKKTFTEGMIPIGRPKTASEVDPRIKKIAKIFDLLDQIAPDSPGLDQIKTQIQDLIKNT